MEKPDADGYVNIKWPSKTIPYGGIFHTRVADATRSQEFLKLLLEESKLDISLRRKSPLALRQNEAKTERQQGVQMPLVRPRTSRRRSLSAIRESGIYEMDPYCPKRGQDREKLKERLAAFMECGVGPEQPPPAPSPCLKARPKLPTSKERWNELVTQIRERAEWLAEMEYLGQAEPHRDIIKDQIAERMRALDALGIESQCSSARSTASGFSTTRSREVMVKTARSKESGVKSVRSNASSGSKKQKDRPSAKESASKKEENISAYSQLSPLQCSPRRRV